MPSGVYMILNTANSKCYVGSAVDFAYREKMHFSKLRGNRHPSRHLQSAWNKYGSACFKFIALEEVPNASRTALLVCEQKWIRNLQPKYNKRLVADSNMGIPHTDEHKAFIDSCVTAWRATPEGKAHAEKLRDAVKASWADPDKREARLSAIKAAWTPEKRAEAGSYSKARQSHIIEDGTHFGTKRQWTDEERAKLGVKTKARWESTNPVSESDIAALVTSTNRNWVAKEMTGVRNTDKVLIACAEHNHEQWQSIAKVKYEKRGCRFCGFARSSEVQKGRPKTSSQSKEK